MPYKRTLSAIALVLIIFAFSYSRKEDSKGIAHSQKTVTDHDRTQMPKKASKSQVLAAEVTRPSNPPEEVPPEVKRLRDEARFSLAGLFSALRAYHSDYGRYSTDLNSIGFVPLAIDQKASLAYKFGFLKPYFPEPVIAKVEPKGENPESTSTDTFMNVPINITAPNRDAPSYTPEARNISLDAFHRYCQIGCTATRDRFEILLVVPLGNDQNDVWLINDKKEVLHACDGLKERC